MRGGGRCSAVPVVLRLFPAVGDVLERDREGGVKVNVPIGEEVRH